MGSDVNIICARERELIKKGMWLSITLSCQLYILTYFSDETFVAVLQAEDGSAGVVVDPPALLPLQEPGPSPRSLQPGPASVELEL